MPSIASPRRIYAFGAFTLDVDRAELKKAGSDARLRPKSFALLCYLVEHRGRVVSKDELLDAIWGRTVVTEGSVTQCLIDVRRALGDASQSFVRTVPRRGYIFDAPVSDVAMKTSSDASAANPHQARIAATRAGRIGNRSAWILGGCLLALLIAVSSAGLLATKKRADTVAIAPATSQAFSAYRQARFFQDRRAPGDLDRAVRLYEESLRFDPRFARAWVGLAAVYRIEVGEGVLSLPLGAAKRRFAVEQALRIDSRLAEAQVEAARLAADDGDTAAAAEHRREAVASSPDDPIILTHLANVAAWHDRLDEAIALARRVVELDPLAAVPRHHLAHLLFANGEFQQAKIQFAKQADLNPLAAAENDVPIGFMLILEHRFDEALASIDRWPAGADRDEAIAMIGPAMGREAEARAAMQRLTGTDDLGGAARLAEVHAFRDNSDEAFHALQNARDKLTPESRSSPDGNWLWYIRFSPFLRPLHADPRWARLRPS